MNKVKDTSGINIYTYNLLFRVLVRREKIYGFHVTKIDVVPQKKYKQKLADILLFLVPV